AFVEYTREGDILAINHTEVPPEMGGRGIAGKLVEAALRYARDEGLKVLPRCSYADAYMRRHPEYEELRVQG
ncbi:MAG TPA: GNAT family N-acetyltransferase, partial [Luteimonas sp.]